MKKILLILATAAISGCLHQTDKSPATTGSPFETAIVIEAENETTGVAKEYEYLRANACDGNGYAKVLGQQLLQNGANMYDRLQVQCADGSEEEYYFNIDSFFGVF